MNVLTRKVLKDVWHRKLRSCLTILGIAMGIMGLVAINVASNQLQNSLAYSADVSAQPDIQFFTSPTFFNVVDELRQQPNVSLVQAQGFVSTRWSIASGHFPLSLNGIVDFQHVQINRFELVEGGLPGPGQVLLESSDRSIASLHVGRQIEVDIQGTVRKLTISGFARTRGQAAATILQRGTGYMRESDLESLFHTTGVNTFLIRIHNYAQRDATARQLSRVFDARHVLILGTQVGHDTSVSTLADGLFSTMRVFSIVAILLSVFLLLGTIMALVAEQVYVMGTMKAIGATRGRIMRHYLLLVTIYGVIGTLSGGGLGFLGGYLLVNYLGSLVNIDIGAPEISSWLLLQSVLIGAGIPVLAATLPVSVGTRITVHQALSGYGLDGAATRRRGLMSRAPGFVPQTMVSGIRNLFRKRVRALLTLLTLTIAGTAFLAVQTTSYSFDSFLGQVFATYHFDVIFSVPEPQPYSKLQQALSAIQGINKTERLSWLTVQTLWGSGLLTGVQQDTQLYQRRLIEGRWFAATDHNVVIISADAASKSGLKVGDSVTFHDSLHTATWHIIGIATDYNDTSNMNFGVLLVPIDQANAFMHLPAGYTRIVMLQASDSSAAGVNALATRVDTMMSARGFIPSVSTAQQQIQRNENEYQILYLLLYAVVIIVALVGMISLFNTLAMSVLERRRETGIMRSMGATGARVAQVFWSEGMALGILAWASALCLGVPAAYGFVALTGHLLVAVPFAFNPLSLLWMLAFIVLVASLACIIPVWSVVRLKIVQTLRYE